jgi:hypothetical protein
MPDTPATSEERLGRLFQAVRRVIRDGIDSPGTRNELHLAFYEERDAGIEASSPTMPDTPSRCLDCDMNPGLCDIHGATPVLTALELANYPIRVVVDQHGHYWRDYGDHWSMCPVSDENRATTPAYEFYPLDHIDVDRLREAARRSGMPRVVSVADIEDLAAEYNYMVERPEEPHDA